MSTDPLGHAQFSSLVKQLRQWQDNKIPEAAPSPVFAHSSVGALLGELIGGRTISGGKPEVESSGDLDIHELPEHWKDEKHEPTGTAPCHLEVSEAIIESRKIVPDDIVQGPIQFTVGTNSGEKIMIDEMAKLEACRLLSLDVDVDKWGAWTCYDDVSGDQLDRALFQAARELAIDFLKNMKVYDIVIRKEMKKSGRGKLIKGRWLDVNKGDSVTPDVRSRYVGKEFATGADASLYAGTPPLEALKMLIGEAASKKDAKLHIMLSDVKRAYFHAAACRELYVEIPREDPDWTPDANGRFNLALYGTRDAAKLWQERVAKHLLSIGFKRGKFQPLRLLQQEDELEDACPRRRLRDGWVAQQPEMAPSSAGKRLRHEDGNRRPQDDRGRSCRRGENTQLRNQSIPKRLGIRMRPTPCRDHLGRARHAGMQAGQHARRG